jgi:hypothetical protein
MRNYNTKTTAASRAALRDARRRVGETPNRLALEAFRMAQLVDAELLNFFEAWEGLWLTATSAGMAHLDAQETIGREFRNARLFPLADVSEVAA